MSKTVREIVQEWLRTNGYDGLCDVECGCEIDDLMPCLEDCGHCVPGYAATWIDDGDVCHGIAEQDDEHYTLTPKALGVTKDKEVEK